MNDFDKALEIIRERGMCKNMLRDEEDRVCIYGALSLAVYSDKECYPLCVAARNHLDKTAYSLFPDRSLHCKDAAAINDHPDTTLEDIELILKHASYEWELTHE